MEGNEWTGERDCSHYKGVLKTYVRKCCGGKASKRFRVGCEVHKKIFAESCRKDICGYYERRRDDV